jgi:hypothetical protein
MLISREAYFLAIGRAMLKGYFLGVAGEKKRKKKVYKKAYKA